MKFCGLSEIKSRRGRRRLILIFAGIFFGILFVLWLFSVPEDLFRGVPYSTVILDKNGELLGARVADDGQWRFPLADSLPEKYVHALIEFEDRNFRHHIGVSFRAILRALVQNIESGEVVSGASTITMQVARMARKRDRTLWQKLIECFWATRIEARYTKDEILRIYASHAPFGGNVVGIDAAMWSYMGRGGSDLSWAEAATLAILPNAPSSVTPVKGRTELLKKRNRLLKRLFQKGLISEFDLEMAMEEPLIGVPQPLPQHAYHLVEKYDGKYHGKKCHTDVRLSLQRRSADMCQRWSREFSQRGIKDMGAVIIEVSSGEVISYVGNSDMERSREGRYVDVADSPRSSGSILKPFLYAGALQDGIILPHTLLPDVPINIGGFAPENFDKSYAGAVPASEALASSLNVPMVILLKQYGVRQFYDDLVSCRLSTLRRDPDAYGLSLILGGAECSLLEISESYAQMAGWYLYGGRGESEMSLFHGWEEFPFRDATALYYTFEAMAEVNRPDQMDWREVPSLIKCAWKTGTSYGSRDAWAVGVTPDYVVGVWVGNADGSGVSDLTGARTAGPVMFDLLSLLPRGESGYRWFPSPEELGYRVVTASVCPESGCLAGKIAVWRVWPI